MSKLVDLQSQIAKLQAEAQQIKSREFDSTVKDILEKMQAFGITVRDLQSPKAKRGPKGVAKKAAAPKKEKGSKSPVAAKYRGPNGENWTGRGLMPRWMTAAIAAGQTKEAFLIKQDPV